MVSQCMHGYILTLPSLHWFSSLELWCLSEGTGEQFPGTSKRQRHPPNTHTHTHLKGAIFFPLLSPPPPLDQVAKCSLVFSVCPLHCKSQWGLFSLRERGEHPHINTLTACWRRERARERARERERERKREREKEKEWEREREREKEKEREKEWEEEESLKHFTLTT